MNKCIYVNVTCISLVFLTFIEKGRAKELTDEKSVGCFSTKLFTSNSIVNKALCCYSYVKYSLKISNNLFALNKDLSIDKLII